MFKLKQIKFLPDKVESVFRDCQIGLITVDTGFDEFALSLFPIKKEKEVSVPVYLLKSKFQISKENKEKLNSFHNKYEKENEILKWRWEDIKKSLQTVFTELISFPFKEYFIFIEFPDMHFLRYNQFRSRVVNFTSLYKLVSAFTLISNYFIDKFPEPKKVYFLPIREYKIGKGKQFVHAFLESQIYPVFKELWKNVHKTFSEKEIKKLFFDPDIADTIFMGYWLLEIEKIQKKIAEKHS